MQNSLLRSLFIKLLIQNSLAYAKQLIQNNLFYAKQLVAISFY